MSQKEAILRHLKNDRTITPMEALERYKCFRLASVIKKLKDSGEDIVTQLISKETNEGRKVYARYCYVA